MYHLQPTAQGFLIQGDLTIFHAAEIHAELRAALERKVPVGLDLSGVEEMDSAGAQILLWLKREARGQGQAAPFVNHSPVVVEVLDQLSLAGVLGDTLVISPVS